MRALARVGLVAAALVLQATLARFLARGSVGVDLVLVAVVYLSLKAGPATGILAGAAAGLAQDALSAGIVGVGGLSKSVAGYLAGTVGRAFIVAQPLPRFFVFFGATLVEMAIVVSFRVVLETGPHAVPFGAVAAQAFGNSLVGVVFFQVVEGVPRAIDRRRTAR
jgi:rod shape-determining protein MreD